MMPHDRYRTRRSALKRAWSTVGPFPRNLWIHPAVPEDDFDRVCARIWRDSIETDLNICPRTKDSKAPEHPSVREVPLSLPARVVRERIVSAPSARSPKVHSYVRANRPRCPLTRRAYMLKKITDPRSRTEVQLGKLNEVALMVDAEFQTLISQKESSQRCDLFGSTRLHKDVCGDRRAGNSTQCQAGLDLEQRKRPDMDLILDLEQRKRPDMDLILDLEQRKRPDMDLILDLEKTRPDMDLILDLEKTRPDMNLILDLEKTRPDMNLILDLEKTRLDMDLILDLENRKRQDSNLILDLEKKRPDMDFRGLLIPDLEGEEEAQSIMESPLNLLVLHMLDPLKQVPHLCAKLPTPVTNQLVPDLVPVATDLLVPELAPSDDDFPPLPSAASPWQADRLCQGSLPGNLPPPLIPIPGPFNLPGKVPASILVSTRPALLPDTVPAPTKVRATCPTPAKVPVFRNQTEARAPSPRTPQQELYDLMADFPALQPQGKEAPLGLQHPTKVPCCGPRNMVGLPVQELPYSSLFKGDQEMGRVNRRRGLRVPPINAGPEQEQPPKEITIVTGHVDQWPEINSTVTKHGVFTQASQQTSAAGGKEDPKKLEII
ncbi:hypothetical protein UPYG_G00330970 [Umbra pygmaea]|uniref:Uncharacterized protein n=1 Tax=Umbra pygmaea TaxID=75934 RepID=A0ABD0VZM6_UMBPY